MASLIEAKIGNHRGCSRVYLAGEILKKEGFDVGVRYKRSNGSKLCLEISCEGDYVVSKRKNRSSGEYSPVLDIREPELQELGVEGRVRVMFFKNKALVLRHFFDDRIKERLLRVVSKLESGEGLKVNSFFHGGGVSSRAIHEGLSKAGVNSSIGMAIEMEGKYLDSSLLRNPMIWNEDSIVMNTKIESVQFDGKGIPKAEICELGIPCVGFSKAGMSKNRLKFAEEHESAGAAFFYALQGVLSSNPCVAILENVCSFGDSASAAVVRSVLGTNGYSTIEFTVSGKDFGAFEDRDRWCMIAVTKGMESLLNLELMNEFHEDVPSFEEILDDDEKTFHPYDYLRKKEKLDIEKGKGFRMQILHRDQKPTKCGVIGRGYAKVRSCEPLISKDSTGSLLRLFSLREHAKVKTIPYDLVEDLSNVVGTEILGQSVIYKAFMAIGFTVGSLIREYCFSRVNQESTYVA